MHAPNLVRAFHRCQQERIKATIRYLQTTIPHIPSCHLITSPNPLSRPMQPLSMNALPPIATPLADPWSACPLPQPQLLSNDYIRPHSSCLTPEWQHMPPHPPIHHQQKTDHPLQPHSNAYTKPPSSCLVLERRHLRPSIHQPLPLRVTHLPSWNTFAPRDKTSSTKSPRSSIAR